MLKIQLILVMGVLLIGAASAGQANETLGHYEVSFSVPVDVVLNKMVKHTETIEGIGYTWYDLTINATNGRRIGALEIGAFDQTMHPPSDDYLSTILTAYGYTRPIIANRTIDNHQGVLAKGQRLISQPFINRVIP